MTPSAFHPNDSTAQRASDRGGGHSRSVASPDDFRDPSERPDDDDRIVVTGLGAVSAAGLGADSLRQMVLEGQRKLTRSGDHLVSPLNDFEPKEHVRPRKALKVMCREIQTAFAAAQMAVKQSGLEIAGPDDEASPPKRTVHPADPAAVDDSRNNLSIAADRVGTVFGCEMLYDPSELQEAVTTAIENEGHHLGDGNAATPVEFGKAAMKKVSPLWLLKYLPNMPACHVGIALGVTGPNNTLVLGDISGDAAIAEAAGYLRRGIADVVVVAASGTRINETRLTYHGDLPLLRIGRDAVPSDWASAGKPGDADSRGVVGGEGAAAIVLERYRWAESRHAKILAEFLGCNRSFVPSDAIAGPRVRTAQRLPKLRRGSPDSVRHVLDSAWQLASEAGWTIDECWSPRCGDPSRDAAIAEGWNASALTNPIEESFEATASVGHCGAASGLMSIAAALAGESSERPSRTVMSLSSTSEGSSVATVWAVR